MVCPREAELVNADTTNGGQPRLRLGHRSLFVAQGTQSNISQGLISQDLGIDAFCAEVLESASVNTLLLVALVGRFRHERALPHALQCYFRKSFPGLRGCKPLISCRLLNRPPRQRNPYAGCAIKGRCDKLTIEGDRNAADCAHSLAGVVLHRIQESARSWLSDPTGCRLYWRQRTQKSGKGNYRGALNTLGRD
jgi:hypothetical protein